MPSLELMETAGAALAEVVRERAGEGPIRVVCGKGNNGGDGLVAARLLRETGHEVEVILLGRPGELSDDAEANLARLDHQGVIEHQDCQLRTALADSGTVVDAIFGTGFSGSPRAPPTLRSTRSTLRARPSSPRTSPPASTPRPARPRASSSRPTRPSPSTPPSSATGSRPGATCAASCASPRSGSPRRARRGRRRADHRPGAGARAYARRRLHQVQLGPGARRRRRRRALPGPSAWLPRPRSAPAPGTPRRRYPSTLQTIVESSSPR